MMLKVYIREKLMENKNIKVYMCHDVSWLGASFVNNYSGKEVKEKKIKVSDIFEFESRIKLDDTRSRKKVNSLIDSILKKEKIPAILVRKVSTGAYQVIDGHHRFWAHQDLGMRDILVKVIPSHYIEDVYDKEDLPKDII